jgi:uncharacterized protein with von Willebrand factor type A (vWA) domain
MNPAIRHSGGTTQRAVNSDGEGFGTRRRLAGFARTLRDNGFRVGLAETSDALQILASPAALKPSALKPALRALFCATRSDWERFDEIFGAFWCGHGRSSRSRCRARTELRRAPVKRMSRRKRASFPIMSNGAVAATSIHQTDAAAAKAPHAVKI